MQYHVFLTSLERSRLAAWLVERKLEVTITKEDDLKTTARGLHASETFERCSTALRWPLKKDESFPINFGTFGSQWLLLRLRGPTTKHKLKFPVNVKLWVFETSTSAKTLQCLRENDLESALMRCNVPSTEGKLEKARHNNVLSFSSKHARLIGELPVHNYSIFYRTSGDMPQIVLVPEDLDDIMYCKTLGKIIVELEKPKANAQEYAQEPLKTLLKQVRPEDLDEFSKRLQDVATNIQTPIQRIQRYIIKSSSSSSLNLGRLREFLATKKDALEKKSAPERSEKKQAKAREGVPAAGQRHPEWKLDVLRKVLCQDQNILLDSRQRAKIAEPHSRKGDGGDKLVGDPFSDSSKIAAKETQADKPAGSKSGNALKFEEKDGLQISALKYTPLLKKPKLSLEEICSNDDALRKHFENILERVGEETIYLSPPGDDEQETTAIWWRDEFKKISKKFITDMVERYQLFHILAPDQLKNLHLSHEIDLELQLNALDSSQLDDLMNEMYYAEPDYWLFWMGHVLREDPTADNIERLLNSMIERNAHEDDDDFEARVKDSINSLKGMPSKYSDKTPLALKNYFKSIKGRQSDLEEFVRDLAYALKVNTEDLAPPLDSEIQTSPPPPAPSAFALPPMEMLGSGAPSPSDDFDQVMANHDAA